MPSSLHPAAAQSLVNVPRYAAAPNRGSIHLASNESALGPSPRALAAARAAIGARYPESAGTALRERLAGLHGLAADNVLVTCGSSEAIQLLVRAFPGEVAVPAGSFPLYVRAATAAGRHVRLAPRHPDHRVDLEALTRCIGPDTALVFVASPDNPTGTSAEGLADWLRTLPWRVVPVVDEAYAEFTSAPDLRDANPNLVVLRSFSKAYGLASLRVGCALGSAPIVAALDRVRDPFNVSAPGLAAGIAALDDAPWLATVRAHTSQGRASLAAGLFARGYRVLPSDANFVFLPEAGALPEVLEAAGITVRRMDAWGFPGAARVTVGHPAEHERLFAALDQACAACAS